MTEAEWRTCDDPADMIDFLHGRVSDRQGRLFVCACCRRIWQLLDHDERAAVLVGEHYADGQASDVEREKLYLQFLCLLGVGTAEKELTLRAAMRAVAPKIDALAWEEMLIDGAYYAAEVAVELGRRGGDPLRRHMEERRRQCDLLRCIFGNPFHAVAIAPHGRDWNGGAVVMIARSIRADQRFEYLPILADALEEAGCEDETLLEHCRQPAMHVRGCWVIERLLAES